MIKRNIIKILVIIIAILFLLITAADMYLKTYGDISRSPQKDETVKTAEMLGKTHKKEPDAIRLMTYNILADAIGYEGTDAVTRARGVCSIINSIAPDVAGLQETSRKWFACIYNNTDYRFIHPVRTGFFQTMTALIYNPRTVIPIASGEETFKNAGDTRLRRMVWAVFHHKETSKSFIVINTHFSLNNREESPADNTVPLTQCLELITLSKNLNEAFNCQVYVLGDFNVKESTEKNPSTIYDILSANFTNAKALSQSISYGKETTKNTLSKDHIFLLSQAEVKSFSTLSQTTFKELSDHFPIFCDIKAE